MDWNKIASLMNEMQATEEIKFTPKKQTPLQESNYEFYMQYKDIITEFEERAKNSFRYLCSISNKHLVCRKVLDNYYDAMCESSLIKIASNGDAALFFELERILYDAYYNAIENIGKGYEEKKFL